MAEASQHCSPKQPYFIDFYYFILHFCTLQTLLALSTEGYCSLTPRFVCFFLNRLLNKQALAITTTWAEVLVLLTPNGYVDLAPLKSIVPPQ